MGEHIHEHVNIAVDSDSVTAKEDDSPEEKLRALVEALGDEDVEVEITTESEEIE